MKNDLSESNSSDNELIEVLWRDFAVDEVALSIAHNGFFRHEPLFVTSEDGRSIVIEGNRRLAAVRLLVDPGLRKKVGATDLPTISAEREQELERLPIVECKRSEIWQYVGFKHVNGPQAWQSYAKAQYIAWVHNETKVPLKDIAASIGDRHATVRRLYRGLMVLHQAQNTGVFNLEDRKKKHFSFSHLYTGLDYQNTRNFLGIDNETSFRPDPVPQDHLRDLGDLCQWLYGRDSTGKDPVVRTQNPDLRNLDTVIGNPDGLLALRQGLPLDIALDITAGDEELFKGHLIQARQQLQGARGRQLTGDPGDANTIRMAHETLDLAEHLVEDMENHRRAKLASRRQKRRPTS